MALSYVTITELAEDGTASALSGTATFTPNQSAYSSSNMLVVANVPITAQVIAGQLLAPAGGPLQLLATDNSLTFLSLTGFLQWTVELVLGGVEQQSFTFALPSSPSSRDLYSLANTPAASGNYLPLPSGSASVGYVPTVTTTSPLALDWSAGGGGGGAVSSVFGRTGAVVATSGDYTVSEVTGAAPLASPALTGTPTAPTATALTGSTQVATTAYADSAVGVETTRAEAAEALKAPLASPALTGSPTAPTQTTGDNSAKIATDQFVTTAVAAETTRAEAAEALLAPKASPALTGTPTAPTASALTDSTQVATTAYADSAVAVETSRAETAEALLAPKASPTFTGTPAAPTASPGTNTTQVATTAFVEAALPSSGSPLPTADGGTGLSESTLAALLLALLAAGGGAMGAELSPKVATLTDAASVLVNAALANDFRLTFTTAVGASRTIAVPTNPSDGQKLIFELIQPSSGGPCTAVWPGPVAAPNAPTLATATTGGTVAAGTYQVEVSYVNALGETTASLSASQVTTGSTSTLTITSPPASNSAESWYAYVTADNGSTYYRQQGSGSPTAIGTNLVLTAPPTTSGANPPGSNTTGTGGFNCGNTVYPQLSTTATFIDQVGWRYSAVSERYATSPGQWLPTGNNGGC